MRSVLTVKNRKEIADGTYDIDAALAKGWTDLDQSRYDSYQQRYETQKKDWEARKGAELDGEGTKNTASARESAPIDGDEDVEMGDDGEEDRSPEGGGFTAVNRG